VIHADFLESGKNPVVCAESSQGVGQQLTVDDPRRLEARFEAGNRRSLFTGNVQ